MMFFGVVGYLMRRCGYEAPPLILAYVLGPGMEQALRQSLILSNGDFTIFLIRPISAVLPGCGGVVDCSGDPSKEEAPGRAGEDIGAGKVGDRVKQIQLSTEIIEGDVLCVGGGIAGLFAAIRAGELGAKVIVADKANTLRSGSAATGNDHFQCYLPEFHGPDIEPVIAYRKRRMGLGGVGLSDAAVRVRIEKSTEIIERLESWGVPMKYKGKYEFAGHAIPGVDFFLHLKYAGMNQKPILTREARKQGVRIVNRVMVFDLIYSNGRPVGAIGVDTRNDKIVIFHVKSVILATGLCGRLYPSPTPGWMFNRADSPHTTGDGRAMAYRAGAELMNMELIHRWAGPKYFSRCGKGTWVGVFRDPQGKAVGPFVTKPDRKYGDAISDAYTGLVR